MVIWWDKIGATSPIGDIETYMKMHAPALALGLTLLCNLCPQMVWSADDTASSAPVTEAINIDAKADAVLHKVSDFYAGLKTFSATLVRLPVKEEGGQELTYKIEALKPSKLSIHMTGAKSMFDGGLAKMDGEKLSLYNPALGYITSKAPSNYDELVRDHEFQFAMAHGFHGQNLLEALLADKPYQFLMQHYGINGGTVVGDEKVDGVSTEHLHLKSNRLAYDVWVESGSKPWVKKVSVVRGLSGGQEKTVTYEYKKLSDTSKAVASDFAFTPPSGAKEIQTFVTAKEPEKKAQAPASAAPSADGNALLNKPAPDLTLDTIGGGKLELASLKNNNVVVLDFWATWCPPCRQALPILASVTKSYEDKGVKFFAVDLKEEQGKIQEFLKNQNLNINVALDKDGSAAEKYGVSGIPQSVIIGKDGMVKVVHVGFSDSLKTNLPIELDQVLSNKEITQ